jgi:hypothetical protein
MDGCTIKGAFSTSWLICIFVCEEVSEGGLRRKQFISSGTIKRRKVCLVQVGGSMIMSNDSFCLRNLLCFHAFSPALVGLHLSVVSTFRKQWKSVDASAPSSRILPSFHHLTRTCQRTRHALRRMECGIPTMTFCVRQLPPTRTASCNVDDDEQQRRL